jgi:coenzyme F420-reducing hydrogenase delta subunit
LDEIGVESQRLQMINVSAAMGGAFAKAASEMAEKVIKIGPNPLKDADEET